MHLAPNHTANDSSVASARRWQSEARCLREQAEKTYLTPKQRALFLREAEAADRQAAWWLDDLKHQ